MTSGGIIPDIDGVHILFDPEKFYRYHHVLGHPPIMGAVLGILIVSFYYFLNGLIISSTRNTAEGSTIYRLSNRFKFIYDRFEWTTGLRFFVAGFFVHILGDIVGTNWGINVLYPIGELNLSAGDYLSNKIIYGIISPFFNYLSLGVLALILFKETFFSPKM
jgi:hypothetical protein